MNVAGKSIMITGAGGGLGSDMARLLSANGAQVFILELDEEKGRTAAEEIRARGGRAWMIQMDVTSEQDWQRAVEEALRQTGRIDALVNNAGINIRKPLEEMSIDEWCTMMKVNTGSAFLGCKYVIPVMRRQQDGVIVNISSVCGLIGHLYTPEAYTASKGAVTMLTKAVASRYAKFGIRCNSVHPSTVDTPFVQTLFRDPARKAERLGEVPLGRLAAASDVSNAVLYLCSDEAKFINGVALPVDGGVTCY
ncbi:MAG: glucose 1-dehydrogenase [Clostridiales bacterium]|nr:glucose 1-dehydrogenase [Clostridiales bacterium]